mgnify:CR=1 FL=1
MLKNIMNAAIPLLMAIIVLMSATSSRAAPSMPSDECTIYGVVISESYRKVEENTILGSRTRYHDVAIDVSSKDIFIDVPNDQNNCKFDNDNPVQTYQLTSEPTENMMHDGQVPNAYTGKCIHAKTRFFADDFGGGNWLSDIKIVDQEKCKK